MALIKCNECGNEIYEKAKACPKCGCPNNLIEEKTEEKQTDSENNQNNDGGTGCIIAFFVFIMFIIAGSIVWAMSWWDNNDMENKIVNGFVDTVNTVTDTYVEYKYDKEREKELKNRVYNALNIE